MRRKKVLSGDKNLAREMLGLMGQWPAHMRLNGGEIRQCAGASRQTDGLPEGKRMPSQGALKEGIPSSTSKEWA